jgi:hypothetical protein
MRSFFVKKMNNKKIIGWLHKKVWGVGWGYRV